MPSSVIEKVKRVDWRKVNDDMNRSGYAVIPGFLDAIQCQSLIELFDHEKGYRKTVVMERYRFGRGCYKYWDYPLPDLIENLRRRLYPKLSPIANSWMKALHLKTRFPNSYKRLQAICHRAGQTKPTPLILKYGAGGYNTLHQDLYGDIYFPIQAACFLSEPEKEYIGGEFILTEQVPRAQSKAIVLKPRRGDIVVFTTNFRPIKGVRGYYRANMRHGVSEVHSGTRYTMGIIFHDAVN